MKIHPNIKIIIQFNPRILKVIKKKSQLQYSKISNFFTKINYKFPWKPCL